MKIFWVKKNIKITKWKHASSKAMQVLIMLKVLNSFNPELQLKDTEFAIKSKLIELLTQLKGFKFVTILVLVSKKKKSDDKKWW